jgi:hypothetical protein
MPLPALRCLFNRHVPRRSAAKWDGLDFVGTCRHCGARIRRKAHKTWLREWMEEADGDPPASA